MSDSDDNYNGVLLEDISHKLDAIIEGEISLATISRKLNDVDERLVRVEDDLNITIRAILKDHERNMREHDEQFKDHKKQFQEHKEQFKDHKKQFKEHKEQFKDHKKQLRDHREQHKDHQRQLKEHRQLLRDHQTLLDNHDRRLARLQPASQL